ncbi:MAG: cytidine deaminase [Clostridia bacterium]|nr:cytidine deaminase [Clostridia bacterium]
MYNELINKAKEAAKNAYSPYSDFKVGAALLCENGNIYTGCNIENSSYSPTVCAERVAIFKAVSDGVRGFTAIAIVGGKDKVGEEMCFPCGVCRQVMTEFCDPDTFKIILPHKDGIGKFSLKELLLNGFKL